MTKHVTQESDTKQVTKDINILTTAEKQLMREQSLGAAAPYIPQLQKASAAVQKYSNDREHISFDQWNKEDRDTFEQLNDELSIQKQIVGMHLSSPMIRKGYYSSENELMGIEMVNSGEYFQDAPAKMSAVFKTLKIPDMTAEQLESIRSANNRIKLFRHKWQDKALTGSSKITDKEDMLAKEDIRLMNKNSTFLQEILHKLEYDPRALSGYMRELDQSEVSPLPPVSAPFNLDSFFPPTTAPSGKKTDRSNTK